MTEERHVWIAIPCYTGLIHMATMKSIIADMIVLTDKGIKVTLFDETGNAMIAHGRDLICAKFMGSDASDLVFVDYDVTWPEGSLARLVEYPVDMVAGLYPKRCDPEGYFVQWIADRPHLVADKDTGLLEVAGVPAGFLRLTRNCLARMIAAYPEKRFADKYAPKGFAWALFDNIHEGDLYFGEDFSFCKRWRDIGGQIWLDPEIPMSHIGNKTFAGHIGNWLKNRPPPASPNQPERNSHGRPAE